MKKQIVGLALILGCSPYTPDGVVRHYENNWVNTRKTEQLGGFILSDVSAKEAEKIKARLQGRYREEYEKGYFVFERNSTAVPAIYNICVSFPEDNFLIDRRGLMPEIRLHELLNETGLGHNRTR
ncbi:MAG TPA: hypothetical protein VJG90_05625 [Candidatus Nanoarchaeia archaeon]|nr:hypothetical protein [Candidatus Nanoarchaeia archaeon]